MSQKDRQQWQAMLDADPALAAEVDGFKAQLDIAFAALKQGKQPNRQALDRAVQAVYKAAGVGETEH